MVPLNGNLFPQSTTRHSLEIMETSIPNLTPWNDVALRLVFPIVYLSLCYFNKVSHLYVAQTCFSQFWIWAVQGQADSSFGAQ